MCPKVTFNKEITVVEEWRVVDKWWTHDEKIDVSYKIVNWNGRQIIFRKFEPETVWRIFNGHG